MEVKYQGYDIECTPEEFNELLRLQNGGKQIEYSHPYIYPTTTAPKPWETGWWGIFPPTITSGDSIMATSDGSACISSCLSAEDFVEKFADRLSKTRINISY